ncbi:Mur ligase family protein [Aerococcaceae bacterium zg-BR22]|uniref:MurT ligase domain-containing protein n=1 Tax=Aerococcaceae bacterium zg-1292 TaxID=2774330 RepID=UPI0040647772|nr:Mur ligase family protein [Aerococcaceae bacterium zg-BR22]
MSLKSILARSAGKLTRWGLTTFTRGGSSLPGKVATTIDPNILSHLANDYHVIIITGTNGKTLTTALTVQALQTTFDHIITNPTGSNMAQGIVSTFLSAPALPKGHKGIAVLEVDEGSLKHVVKHLQPIAFVHTNVFRDQMDRYGEIYSIYQLMTDAAKQAPEATIIANGDSPLFNSIELPNPRIYFGFDHESDHDVTPHYNTDGLLCPHCHKILQYHALTYANLGKYYCPSCDFKRPELTDKVTQLDELALTHSQFAINGHPFRIPVAGLYNIYNALAAYSVASFLDVKPDAIAQGFAGAGRVFGRQEIFEIDGKKVLLNLVKNPVGLNQVLELIGLDKNPFTLVSILNNRYADGTDVSWIWDGNYEQIVDFPIEQVITSGMRADEMTLRLKVAGINPAIMAQVESHDEIIQRIQQADTEYVHILATYTAMLDLRETLIKRGYLKK